MEVSLIKYYLTSVNGKDKIYNFVVESENKMEAELFTSLKVFAFKERGKLQDVSDTDVLMARTNKISRKKYDEIIDSVFYLGKYSV